MTTPIQAATKRAPRKGSSGRAIPEPEDYQDLRRSLSYEDLLKRGAAAAKTNTGHAYHWYRAAKENIAVLDSEKRRYAQIRELDSLEDHLRDHAFTAAELVERFSHEAETAEETLARVAVEVINELHSPMFTTYEENRARCIARLRPLREYVVALDRSLKARRAAQTTKDVKATKPLELTGQQIELLSLLGTEPMMPDKIAAKMGKSKNAARTQGNRLARMGLAERVKTAAGFAYRILDPGREALAREDGRVVDLMSRR